MRRLPATLWVTAIALLFAYQAFNALTILTPELNDFGRFWASSRAVLEGRSPYVGTSPPKTGGPVVDRNLNPPPVVYALVPLGLLSPHAALGIWTAVSVAAMTAVLWLTIRVRRGWAGPIVALALTLGATGAQVKTGQVALLLALPMALSWRAMRENRPGWAGGWLGVCLAAKPFLVLFPLAWILGRRYRPAFIALAVAGGIHAVGLVAAGIGGYREWLALLKGVYWPAIGMNFSITGFAYRVWRADIPLFVPLWLAPHLVPPTILLMTGIALAFTCWWARAKRDPDHDYLVLGLLALLVSPLGWAYYLWLVMPPLCLLMIGWLRSHEDCSDYAIVAALLLCIPVTSLSAGQPNRWLTVTLGSAYFWGSLLLLRNAAADVRRGTRLHPHNQRAPVRDAQAPPARP